MRGVLLLLAASFLWSLGGILIKLIDASPLAVSSGRSVIAAVVLVLLTRRIPLAPSTSVLRCAVFYALTVMTFVLATKLTTATNAIVLQYAAPVYVALLSARFLGERVTRRDWAAIILVLTGMVIFFAEGIAVGSNVGNLIGAISGFCFALLVVSLRQIHAQHPVDAVIIGNIIAAAIGLPWLIATEWNTSSVIGVVLLGTFQLGLSYYLYTKAIAHVTALEAVLIPVLEPILNPLWVYLVLGERPSLLAVAGAGVILAAVTWRAIGTRKSQPAVAGDSPAVA